MENGHFTGSDELERFRSIRWFHNHWSRPIAPRAYYWYLTFENTPELHSLARECQRAISFPYFDLIPLRDLHLTLDRISLERDTTPETLDAIKHSAIRACEEILPFDIIIGTLGGTPGAVGFTAYPAGPIRKLRDTLHAATLSVYPRAPVRNSGFHPHVTIAYANSDSISAMEAIAVVEKLSPTAQARVRITEATLVILERRPRSYAWNSVSRIPLAG